MAEHDMRARARPPEDVERRRITDGPAEATPEEVLSALVGEVADGLLATDRHGTLITGNAVVRTLFGISLEELRGAPAGAVHRLAAACDDAGRAEVLGALSTPPGHRRSGSVRTADGELRGFRVHALPGAPVLLWTWNDASDDAGRDALTGLPRYARWAEWARGAVASSPSDGMVGVLSVDLDRLGRVNERHGYAIGDTVLEETARRLRSLAQAPAVARIGGDEFAVLLPSLPHERAAFEAAREVRDALDAQPAGEDAGLGVTGSIGVAVARAAGADIDRLLRDAAGAARRAKERPTRIELADRDLHLRVEARRRLEDELTGALARGEMELLFQPILEAAGTRLLAFEALIRWNHPERGTLAPGEFLPAAADAGCAEELDRWALMTAARQLASWQALATGAAEVMVAVNLSTAHAVNPGFAAYVEEVARTTGVRPRTLVLELDGSSVSAAAHELRPALQRVREAGARISLDRFGEASWSVRALSELPCDAIKIHRSVVSADDAYLSGQTFLSALVEVTRSLGLWVIADGVETAEELKTAKRLGFHAVQGFVFARPASAAAVTEVLQAHGVRWPAPPHAALALADDELVPLAEAASMLGLSTSTVRRLVDSGRLPSTRTPGGHRRLQRAAVEALQAQESGAAVRRISPPPTPTPVAAAVLQRPEPLVEATLRRLYESGREGWFATREGRVELAGWFAQLGVHAARGDFDRHAAPVALLQTARRAGTTPLERAAVVERAGDTVAAAVAEREAGRTELPQVRRLFRWLLHEAMRVE